MAGGSGTNLQSTTKRMPERSTHILRTCLLNEPEVYRDIEIDSGKSLADLAEAIVGAFDFEFDHAFGFYSSLSRGRPSKSGPSYELFADMGESDAFSVRNTRIAEAFSSVGKSLIFMFDYGDEWLFRIELTGTGTKAPRSRYPKVLAKAGTSPEQYPAWEGEDHRHVRPLAVTREPHEAAGGGWSGGMQRTHGRSRATGLRRA